MASMTKRAALRTRLILLGVAGLPLIGLLERSAQRVRGRWLSPEEANR